MDRSLVEINRILAQYTNDVNKDVDAVMKEGAQNASKTLQRESPADEGDYAKSWSWKQEKKTGNYVVYNKDHYRLTHLLENGHDIVAWGKKVGHVKAHPHIKKVEDLTRQWVTSELEDRLSNEH